MYILLLFSLVNLILSDEKASEDDSSHIHLNIEYPKDDTSTLNLTTGDKEETASLKTPVVIISPKALVDYERLYKKMMEIKPGSGNSKRENDALYDEKVASTDPIYKREMLYNLLKDVESRIAFYRADANEIELLMSSNYEMAQYG